MSILPTSFTPLFPVHPNRADQIPKPEGSPVFGKPLLTFPEVKPPDPKDKPSTRVKSPFEDFLDGRLKDLLKPQNDSLKTAPGPRYPESLSGDKNRVLGNLFDTTA